MFKIGELVYSRQPLSVESAMIWKEEDDEVIADKSDIAMVTSEPQKGFGEEKDWYRIRFQKSGRVAMMPAIELIRVGDVL
jgi:hypothetical protein